MKKLNIWRYKVEYQYSEAKLGLPVGQPFTDTEYGTIITPSTEAATVCKEIYDELGEGYKIVELDLRYKNSIVRKI